MEEILKEIEELKKRVAALEGQVQAQPVKVSLNVDGKSIAQCLPNSKFIENLSQSIGSCLTNRDTLSKE